MISNSAKPLGLAIEWEPTDYCHFKREFKGQSSLTVYSSNGKPGLALARNRESCYIGMNVSSLKIVN